MARMPAARWQGEHSPRRRMDRYDIVCVHTIVGYAPAHAAHFSVHQGGTIDQSRDTRYQSGANLEGNPRVIAIENEDHGSAFPDWNTRDGHAVPALTDEQVEANAKILAWVHKTHGVPLQLCPNSRPGSQGLGYHRQGIDGNWSSYDYGGRVSGGETWTTSPGKVCPGDRRIAQLPDILDRAKQIVGGDVSYDEVWRTDGKMRPPPEWTDYDKNPHWWPETMVEKIGESVADLRDLTWSKPYFPDDNKSTLPVMIRWTHSRVRYLEPIIEQNNALLQTLVETQHGGDVRELVERQAAEATAQREALAEQITQAAEAAAQRDAELLALVEAVGSGERDAADVVDEIARRLRGDTDDA